MASSKRHGVARGLLLAALMGLAPLWLLPLRGVAGAAPAAGVAASAAGPGPGYAAWREACRRLPTNLQLGARIAPAALRPLKAYPEFGAVVGAFLDLSRTGVLAVAEGWLGGKPGEATFFDASAAYFRGGGVPFQPYAERVEVAPGTRVFLHGDLHGDIHSLLAYLDLLNGQGILEGFRVARPDVRLVFLGDYTDRGRHGVEVIYTLLRLKLESPGQVHLVRGNHEDILLTARYGFLQEAVAKFGRAFEVERVSRIYDFMPAVLYLASGGDAVQCNHGGLEPGYAPGPLLDAAEPIRFQLLGRLEQRRLLSAGAAWMGRLPEGARRELGSVLADFVPASPTQPAVLGFLWNDFTVMRGEPQFAVDPGRALVYGDAATRTVLELSSGGERRVRAIVRGHQHAAELNPMMARLIASRGVFRHWQERDGLEHRDARPAQLAERLDTAEEREIPDGSVWTFNVSPDSVYGAGCNYAFGAFGELRVAERWEGWRMRVWNYPAATR